MLDKLTAAVLAAVNARTDGSYKVLEEGDILSALPDRFGTDPTGLSNALRYLSERGYIDIKYSDKGTYCVCSLPKGRSYEETSGAERRSDKKSFRGRLLLTFFGSMLGAFVGGVLAGMLIFFTLA